MIGKLKICRLLLIAVIVFGYVITLFPQTNFCCAESIQQESDFDIDIISNFNSTKLKNNCLISNGEIVDEFIYDVKNSDNKNLQMSFVTNEFEFSKSKSILLWIYVSDVLIYDEFNLRISSITNQGSYFEWNFETDFDKLIFDYENGYTKGWKLLKLSGFDATLVGNIERFNQIFVSYGSKNLEMEDNNDFSVSHFFIQNSAENKSKIIAKQNFVVVSKKNNILANSENVYVGDEISFKKDDLYKFVVVGKQNILVNESGYDWSVLTTKPSGNSDTITFNNKITLNLNDKGYYLIDINLYETGEYGQLLFNDAYNISAEIFSCGFFQKNVYDVLINSTSEIYFTLNNDFVINENGIDISVSDKKVVDFTYYRQNDKIILQIEALNSGKSDLIINLGGKKFGEGDEISMTKSVQINVVSQTKNYDRALVIIFLCIIFVVTVIYFIIIFVKARKFDVK